MTLAREDLESIHTYSSDHRDFLARSETAGCFYCLAIFNPSEIREWVDGAFVDTGDPADGVTALCPRCGIDSVLPSAAPLALTPALLRQMNDHWF
jgi:hypothetical protein